MTQRFLSLYFTGPNRGILNDEVYYLLFWLKLLIKLVVLCFIISLELSQFLFYSRLQNLTWRQRIFFMNWRTLLVWRQLVMVTSQILSETFPLRGVFNWLSGYQEIGEINSHISVWGLKYNYHCSTLLTGGSRGSLSHFTLHILSVKNVNLLLAHLLTCLYIENWFLNGIFAFKKLT